ncbi:phosphate starvation-induced protein PhoH (plasmid) [Deferribacter desulfuricans SSM1]|uniref:Phosphate starvation-induced protein PhoH n=1 Tax=Deferribacter desulfuricans (strain DSM 14783 / JCM 11476 / NBRC 101012 / SSM1) TaxID=639282 RepID=D3PEP4_DEFDS|nr:PhoH family protein [Deferribacter desulfuricans]BAI81686.1 phosphate starvation-induced protein PhoH [Deferribacter desulfuricans SSM1]
MQAKLYVLDTNILLYDPDSLNGFEEHVVCIPSVVLEELDKFKKDNNIRGLNARKVIRKLDTWINKEHYNIIIKNTNFDIHIISTRNDLNSIVFIINFITKTKEGAKTLLLDENKNDDKIIIDVQNIEKYKEKIFNVLSDKYNFDLKIKNMIFVSKDLHLRIKAKLFDILTEDYRKHKLVKLPSFNGLYLTVPSEIINQIYSKGEYFFEETHGKYIFENNYTGYSLKKFLEETGFSSNYENIDADTTINYNDYFLIRSNENEKHSVLVRFVGDKLLKVENINEVFGIYPKNHKQKFFIDALLNDTIDVVFGIGVAGSGKTLLSIAAGLYLTLEQKKYNKIIVTRPVIPFGRDIGFLPGSAEEKVHPYMLPIFDNIDFIFKDEEKVNVTSKDYLMQSDLISIMPLPFIRGRSFNNSFIIVDEAQNLTPLEVKTILTRVGENSKIVLTGDIFQIDVPYIDERDNGLIVAAESFRENNIKNSAVIFFDHCERSIVADIASQIL